MDVKKMNKKKSPWDYLTKDEKQLIEVLETAIKNAKSVKQVEEAKQCIGKIMMKIPMRMQKVNEKSNSTIRSGN